MKKISFENRYHKIPARIQWISILPQIIQILKSIATYIQIDSNLYSKGNDKTFFHVHITSISEVWYCGRRSTLCIYKTYLIIIKAILCRRLKRYQKNSWLPLFIYFMCTWNYRGDCDIQVEKVELRWNFRAEITGQMLTYKRIRLVFCVWFIRQISQFKYWPMNGL